MIILAGRVHIDPEHLDAFLAEARASQARARSADGNEDFACAVEDAGRGALLFFERWRDQAALDAYLATPAVRALFETWGPRLRNAVLKYDAANPRGPLESAPAGHDGAKPLSLGDVHE